MNISNQVSKFWNGNLTLWKSYWIVGELINAVIIIIIINIELKLYNNTNIFQQIPLSNFGNLSFFSKFILFFWTIFITVGIWRSAENYKGKLIWIILTLIILSYRIFNLRVIVY